HYNHGNYLTNRGDLKQAVQAFKMAHKMEPGVIIPLVNASIAYARLGDTDKARKSLEKAAKLDPKSPEVNFNLGLLAGEKGDVKSAESHLRAALKADPNMPQAAFNLGVLLAKQRPDEAIRWCTKAFEMRPNDPKYGFTLAFYLNQQGDAEKAIGILRDLMGKGRADADVYMLLGGLHERKGDREKAAGVYWQGANDTRLPRQVRRLLAGKYRALAPTEKEKQ
ncbi:tetratricopeptide repeat protein, partial [Thermodesulfobacteriota bacterium]